MMFHGQPPARPRLRTSLMLVVLGLGAGFFLSSSLGGEGFFASVFDGGGLAGGLNAARREVAGTGIRMDNDLVSIITSIANAAIPYAGIATFVAFVVAGFMFILGFGSDSTVQRAKNVMIWSAVGFIVIIISYVITQFVYDLFANT